jgi:hypothetical protein
VQTRLITREKAAAVAAVFRRHPLVHGVNIVGSVAVRGSSSHDLDLELLCNEIYVERFEQYQRAVASLDASLSDMCPPSLKSGQNERLRALRIAEILADNFPELLREAQQIVGFGILDLFIKEG